MDVFAFWFPAAVAGTAAVGGARKVLERRRARKQLAALPAIGTTTADGTVVRVTGTVRLADAKIVAPLSNIDCVVVRARAQVAAPWAPWGWMPPWPRHRLLPGEAFSMVPFVLERDGEPPIAIEGEHALLDVSPVKLPRYVRLGSPDHVRREQLLVRLGMAAQVRRLSFEEVVVTPGMRISIAGLMMLDPAIAASEPRASELGFRDAPPPALRIAGNAEHPLVIVAC